MSKETTHGTDDGFFVFYETWETRALWQGHMNAPHLAAYLVATKDVVEKFTVTEMTKVKG